ncbi:TonB-dependent receptor plug domain-containing protein [Idiomarina aminovorans]|uniref:TonB-dependent receptor plug domain-containing protein n=1 Tax=Idiomarina aminovorans TaxID=2914829 RepID=UPI002002B179|nr:TonB-dependent receptor [Idiomarina sp. ATCH4]MCK7459345.1 TonB-dependent receptor [Idiomarina sp. ATCH4]
MAMISATLLTGNAMAQSLEETHSNAESAADVMETITIVGGIETSAQEAMRLKADAPNAMEVIDAEQLMQFNEQALGDALRRLPGVTFDGANRSREVRVRGLPGEYTQVLINGRPMIDGESRRSFEVDRIPTGLVERVEVIRSPRAIYNAQGAAGTVNIVLKNGVDSLSDTELAVGAGYLEDNGEQGEASFSHGERIGALEVALAGSLQRFRRSESKDEFEFGAGGVADGGVLELNERRFDQVNFIPRFALQTERAGRFEFDPFYLRTKEFRDDIETDLEDDQATIDRVSDERRERVRESYGFRADWKRAVGESARLRAGFDWQQGETDTGRDETRFNADDSIDRERQRTELIDLSLIRPEVALNIAAGAHDLRFGAGAELREHDETNSEIRNGELRSPREDRVFGINEDVLFAYAEDVWQANERLGVTSGLRLESSDTETTDFFGTTISEDVTFLLPSVNLVFSATPNTNLRLGVARTLRRPDLRSLSPAIDEEDGTPAEPDEQGNPNQQPESIWGLDIGVDHYFTNDRGYVSLNLFARKFEDKIELLTEQVNERFVASPRNVGDARASGVELSGRMPLDLFGLSKTTLWGNATYIDSSVDQINGGSRRFLNQPDAVANLGIDYFFVPWQTTFGLSINHTTSVEQIQNLANDGFLDQSIEERTRLDLSIKSHVTEKLELSLSATNLLGQTEDRIDRVLNEAGVVNAVTRTQEPTYRNVFARLKWRF